VREVALGTGINGTTAHRFDHSKVDWKGLQATPNSTSQSVGANDD